MYQRLYSDADFYSAMKQAVQCKRVLLLSMVSTKLDMETGEWEERNSARNALCRTAMNTLDEARKWWDEIKEPSLLTPENQIFWASLYDAVLDMYETGTRICRSAAVSGREHDYDRGQSEIDLYWRTMIWMHEMTEEPV